MDVGGTVRNARDDDRVRIPQNEWGDTGTA
jgi:hypothetical protein